jgi:hypothetical protein
MVPSRLLAWTTIGFAPYSEKQLRDILTSKARAAGFSKHRCRLSDTLALALPSKSVSAVGASEPVSTSTSTCTPSEVPPAVEAVHVHVPATGREREKELLDFSADIDAFACVMLIALPQMLAKTRHVGDLWEACMALWGYMFSASTASQYIRATDTDTDLHDPSRPLRLPPGGDSSNASCAVPSRVGERFHIDFKAVKMATQQMLLMPATHVLKVQGTSRRKSRSASHSDSHSHSHVQHIDNKRLDGMDAVTEKRASAATARSERRSIGIGAQKRSLRCDLLQAAREVVTHFIDANLRKCAMLRHAILCYTILCYAMLCMFFSMPG